MPKPQPSLSNGVYPHRSFRTGRLRLPQQSAVADLLAAGLVLGVVIVVILVVLAVVLALLWLCLSLIGNLLQLRSVSGG